MAKSWDELSDGTLKLTVSPDEGGPASVFYGKTREEIYDKVLDSQANANRRIDQLRISGGKPNGHAATPPPSQPKPMTANERMQAVADLNNPATVDQAVTRVMESVIGPIDEFQQDRAAQRQTRADDAAVSAAEEFTALTPEFFLTDFNCTTLVNYMRSQNYPPDQVASYQRAYRELAGAKLLQEKSQTAPTEAQPPADQPENNAPNVSAHRAPARYSTGVRQSGISGTPPVPAVRLKYSREQITNMSAATFKRSMSDPEFQRAVEFYSKRQRPVSAVV